MDLRFCDRCCGVKGLYCSVLPTSLLIYEIFLIKLAKKIWASIFAV